MNFFLFIASVVLACQLAYSQNSTTGYQCSIANCQTCSFVNFCGLCKNNYILQINFTTSIPYCQQVLCSVPNCQTCYINNTCQVCNVGYYVYQGSCMSGIQPSVCEYGCLTCNGSTCLQCWFGMYLYSGDCFPLRQYEYSNCLSSFSNVDCQLCITGFIVGPTFRCVPNPGFTCNSLTNCYQCNMQNLQISCTVCNPKYSLSQRTCATKTCQVGNCSNCNGNKCTECLPGYQLVNSNQCSFKIFQCNVTNCLYCKSPNVCALCEKNYYPKNIVQNSVIMGSNCVQYSNSVGSIVPVTNCQTYGPMIPGSSMLQIGCTKCMPKFVLVAGNCVANISLANYTCNVTKCKYCVQNDVCGECMTGYTIRQGTQNICVKIYSPISSCYLSAISATCDQCQNGSVQLFDGSCVKLPDQNITCNVVGCNFCVQDDVCYQCLNGYTLEGQLCKANCSVANCYECSSNLTCGTCNVGYYLNSTTAKCQTINNQTASFCASKFGANCSQCTYYNCTQCSPGNTLNSASNLCCPTPVYNMIYCTQYQTTFSNQSCSLTVSCIACSPGAMLVQSVQGPIPIYICVGIPCSIKNCAYCFQSTICSACNTGYNLVNNTCVAYTVASTCTTPNCVTCNSNNVCTKCLYGYLLYSGVCICNFQNCLQCIGNTLCTQCAYPTKASSLYNSGCLPYYYEDTLCNVTNCENCMNINFCAECSYGFSLQANGACTQNICNQQNNCSLCNLQQTICYSCKMGYMQMSVGSPSCLPIPNNYSCFVNACSFCQPNNPNICQKCIQNNYVTSAGQCQSLVCVQNCVYCLVSNSCVVCQTGFYLTTNNTCVIDIGATLIATCPSTYTNCISCQNQGDNVICVLCVVGMQPSADQQSCVPQDCAIPYCQICKQSTLQFNYIQMCLVCQQGYQLNSYSFCSPMGQVSGNSSCQNIYNCIYCAYNNYCVSCATGWNPVNGTCITNSSLLCLVPNCLACTQSTICVSCASPFSLTSNNTCVYNCNIANCQTCNSLTTCSLCVNNLVLGTNNTTCICPGTFELINSTCICPNNTANSTNNCIQCQVQNCLQCSSPNICQLCTGNLTLNASSNSCSCPDSTFIVVSGSCVCPSNFTYLTNSTTCIPCNVTNCIFCSSSNVCQTCVGNLALANNTCGCDPQETLLGQQCIPCFNQYCLSCTSPNFCNSCEYNTLIINSSGYCVCPQNTNFYNNTCIPCNIQNCILCVQSNICTTCQENYYGLSATTCVLCNISNCISCSSPNYCTSCSDNLQVNSLRNLCVNCTVENCSICLNNQTCAVCDSGYFIDQTGSTCGTCDLVGCTSCYNISICQTCLSGYSLSAEGACILCLYPCATCENNSPSTCLSCQAPYSLSSTNGTCYTCNLANCLDCLPSNYSQCQTCQPNYILSANNTCVYDVVNTCSILCSQCLLNQICQQCNSGYSVNPTNNSQCIPCTAPNCYTCSSTDVATCLTCISGYYITINGTCNACPYSNCQTCTSDSCLTFLNSTNQTVIVYNNTVYPIVCDPGCLNCSSTNSLSCITCATGYTMNTSVMVCVACLYPCYQCGSNAPSVCSACYENFVLINGSCVSCTPSSSCLTCSNTNLTQCLSCPNGYYLGSGICLYGCPSFCTTCTSPTFCTVCQSGYAASSLQGQCFPCLANCRVCSGNTLGVCLACGQGFYLSADNSSCISCPLYCQSCNQQGCLQCLPGYIVTSNQTCVLTCNSPCATCITNNPNACTTCLFGYSLNSVSNTCSPVLQCPGGVCYTCPLGSILSTTQAGTCTQCTASSNCARCSSTNLALCLSCQNNYYLLTLNYTCVLCPSQCQTCTSPNNCLTCASGYTIQMQPIPLVPGVCIMCQSPCAQCQNSSTICTSCVSGYSLDGWNCQTNFNFQFVVTLNTSGSYLYNMYDQFLLALIKPINQTNIQIISVNTLLFNSSLRRMLSRNLQAQNNVIMSGSISTTTQPNSTAAGDQFYALQTAFSSGNIGGIPVQSYDLIADGGTVPPKPTPTPSSNSNLGLIIALSICIPLIIIVLLFAIWQMRRRKNLVNKNELQTKIQKSGRQLRQQFELKEKVQMSNSSKQAEQMPDI